MLLVFQGYQQTEVAKERYEGLLVDLGELLAQLDEVAARDGQLIGGLRGLAVPALLGGREFGSVGQRGVTARHEVVLREAVGVQAVVVRAQRVEAVVAADALW